MTPGEPSEMAEMLCRLPPGTHPSVRSYVLDTWGHRADELVLQSCDIHWWYDGLVIRQYTSIPVGVRANPKFVTVGLILPKR